jgi:Uma2 family endonuclease
LLKAGIPLVWVVDPEARDVTVHRQGKEPQVLESTQELTGEDVLPDFRCQVADLFFTAGT